VSDLLGARLRAMAHALPPAGRVLLSREDLLGLADEAGDEGGGGDLTADQAAAALGISGSRVRRLLAAGELAGFRIGRGRRAGWRIPRAAVAAFRARGDQAEPPAGRVARLDSWRQHVANRP
jgi:excisionase family DNA binding protein